MTRKPGRQGEYGSKRWLESQYARSHGDPWGLDWRPSQKYRYRVMLDTLREQIPVPSGGIPRRVLDIGCATGLFTSMLASLVSDDASSVTGIDVVEEAVAQARRLHPGIEFISMSLDECASRYQASAGVVTCLEVLYYLAPDRRRDALIRLKSMLQPGGLILVSSMIARSPYMSTGELRDLVGSEFEVIHTGVLCLKPVILIEKLLMRLGLFAGRRARMPGNKSQTMEWTERLSRLLPGSYAQSHAYVLARRPDHA